MGASEGTWQNRDICSQSNRALSARRRECLQAWRMPRIIQKLALARCSIRENTRKRALSPLTATILSLTPPLSLPCNNESRSRCRRTRFCGRTGRMPMLTAAPYISWKFFLRQEKERGGGGGGATGYIGPPLKNNQVEVDTRARSLWTMEFCN